MSVKFLKGLKTFKLKIFHSFITAGNMQFLEDCQGGVSWESLPDFDACGFHL